MSSSVVIIMTLLCSTYCGQQEMKLIAELNDFFNFDHNIFLLDSQLDSNGFINTTDVTPRSVFVVKDGYQSEEYRVVKTTNPFVMVFPATTVFNDYYHLMRQALVNTNINTKIGIFFIEFASTDILQKLFQWCKESRLFNVFVTTYPRNSTERLLNIFTSHPFGEISIINATDCSFTMFFASVNSNFHRHHLQVEEDGDNKELWKAIFSQMNATYEEAEFGRDVLVTSYPQLDVNESALYPVEYFASIIVVPESQPYPGFSAYLRTATTDEFFGYSLLTIAAIILLLTIFRYIKQKKILFFQSVSDVMNLLMFDNGYIKYQLLSYVEAFLIVPLTFVGLVVVNGILSNLQSYLTRPVYQPQIKTLEDINRSQFSIVTVSNDWKDYLIEILTEETTLVWKDKLTTLDDDLYGRLYSKNLYSFNTSAAYLTDTNIAKILLKYQKSLNIRGYYLIEPFSMPLLFSYFVGKRFVFVDRANEILHRMQSAGLIKLWEKKKNNAIEKSYAEKFMLSTKPRILDENELDFPIFIAYGWLASIIVFVIEIIWKNFSEFLHKKLRYKRTKNSTTAAITTISNQHLSEKNAKTNKQQEEPQTEKENEINMDAIEENEYGDGKIQERTLPFFTAKHTLIWDQLKLKT